jgi:LAO/AO transport system kinase
MTEVWADITTLAGWRRETGHFASRRAEQARHWFEEEVRQGLLARLSSDPAIRPRMQALGDQVANGLSPSTAAAKLLALLAKAPD